jgi:NAD(P)-dependent dehydrogenase (short-subunit alcohol dehydrogenase family)
MARFTGRSVLVAGATGGVGAAAARRFATEGANVAVLYRSRADTASRLVEELAGPGRTVLAVQADLAVRSEVDTAVATAVDAFGGLDAFVSTVGATAHMTGFLDVDDDLIHRTVAVELVGAMYATRAVLPTMVAAGGGRLVYVGSDSGKVGAGGEAVSAACRGGLIAFAKSVAREFARSGVTANVVCPGPINTELWQALLRREDEPSQRLARGLIRGVPLRRAAEPEEVAAVAVFLASDDASFVTGQALSASGGLTMC